MITDTFKTALEGLTEVQRQAACVGEGAVLVLAGPGSGKTQVLTCRIARLLEESSEESFKVLALTFTDKAAREMLARVQSFVPGLEERSSISTFHSFCAQVLRQHGIHLDLKPDFSIFSQDRDRQILLEEGLQQAAKYGEPVDVADARFLPIIDKLKVRLVDCSSASTRLSKHPEALQIERAYKIYEARLRSENALDFNSLIFEAHALFTRFPAIAKLVRRVYRYWLLDEFQDTTDGQYRLLKAMAGNAFSNVFAVADDDQIIYQWNGASFLQIQRFTTDFKPAAIQLTENWRCPPSIVAAANKLVAYNTQRTANKKPLIAGKTKLKLPIKDHIRLHSYANDSEEFSGVATDIASRPASEHPRIAVLARTRALLEKIQAELSVKGIAAVLFQRRNEFQSPEFRWLAAFLKQAIRPLDKRNLPLVVDAYNRMLGETQILTEHVIARAEASGRSYAAEWLELAIAATAASQLAAMLNTARDLIGDVSGFRRLTETMILHAENKITEEPEESDLQEDLAAWKEISRDISLHTSSACTLDQFLQELDLRSKEPTPPKNAVSLMTIHGAKGREFDFVYLAGLAEDTLPSFQAIKAGNTSPEMEEERRNCFVAITRTKEQLTLSWAGKYRGWPKEPSRFLEEMGFAS